MPYIEKQNGNIYARLQDFETAIEHYEKSLFAMKTLFDGFGDSGANRSLINDRDTALRYIVDEI